MSGRCGQGGLRCTAYLEGAEAKGPLETKWGRAGLYLAAAVSPGPGGSTRDPCKVHKATLTIFTSSAFSKPGLSARLFKVNVSLGQGYMLKP